LKYSLYVAIVVILGYRESFKEVLGSNA